MPTEKPRTLRSAASVRPTRSSQPETRAASGVSPWAADSQTSTWRAVMKGGKRGVSIIEPIRRDAATSPMRPPITEASPSDGRIRPSRMRNRVDLPAPFGPSTP